MTVSHIKQNNHQIWFDKSLIKEIDKDVFNAKYWQKNNAIIGQAKGREITWFVQTETLQAALRHYYRGGLFGKIVKDSYFFTSFENTRSAKEFALLTYLHSNGLNVPRPIAAMAVKNTFSYQADILVEKIQHSEDLVSVLKKAPMTEACYEKIGALIKKMHQLQVCHTDLNIHNILRDNKENFWIIDFDKCDKRRGDDWKQSNLDRLYRSFIKELQKEQIHWSENNWQQLLQGYD